MKGQVVAKETGNVNQLAIQNNGPVTVFVQSGDIVKGGRQNRTMQYDMTLPPKSDLVLINSFCVEHGRWSNRGTEVLPVLKKLMSHQHRPWLARLQVVCDGLRE